jgi:hypothetical protein
MGIEHKKEKKMNNFCEKSRDLDFLICNSILT